MFKATSSTSVGRARVSRRRGKCVDTLEPRVLFSTYTVNTTADITSSRTGQVSLRMAIDAADLHAGSDTINFSSTVFKPLARDTITLGGTPLVISDRSGGLLSIVGPSGTSVPVSGNNLSRVLTVISPTSITGLTFTNGNASGNNASFGGAIYNTGTLTLANSTVKNSTAAGSQSNYAGGTYGAAGGGIYSTGTLTLTNDTVSGNTALADSDGTKGTDAAGGGVFSSGKLTASSCTFSSNTSSGGNAAVGENFNGVAYGGGLYVSGTASISNSTVTLNTAVVPQGTDGGAQGNALGGGVYSATTLTLTDDTISSNTARGYDRNFIAASNATFAGDAAGGGVYATQPLTLGGGTVSGNSALAGLAYYSEAGRATGGGIDAESTLSVTGATISGNTSKAGDGDITGISFGGGVYGASTLSISNSTISGNTSTGGSGTTVDGQTTGPFGQEGDGGGIFASGKLTLTNSTLTGNTAAGGAGAQGLDDSGENNLNGGRGANGLGGGISLESGATINDSTISANTVTGGAGAPAGGPTYTAGANGKGSGGGIYVDLGSALLNNTIVAGNSSNGYDVGGKLSTASGYNLIGGGSTGLMNNVNGNRLGVTNPMLGALADNGGPTRTMLPQAGSVAIDHGSNALLPAGVTTDQRGLARVNGTSVDIGAVETPAVATSTVQLTGTVIGTAGSYGNAGNTINKVFDGILTNYFDAPTASGAYAGLDLGSAKVVTQVKFAPRVGYASRMVGGVFQGSNASSFSGAVTLYTVTTAPPQSTFTTANFFNTTAYRYVRYVGPANAYCDVAEVQFFGPGAGSVSKFSGTLIGTAGSYNNSGNTIAKAVDGSLSTYFDGQAANGNFLGLDLGSAKTVTQVKYAPRSGYGSRLVGGSVQGGNTADFSSGVVTLLTITSTPAAGSLATASLTTTGSFRYYRYLSPAGSYGDIAEIEFDG